VSLKFACACRIIVKFRGHAQRFENLVALTFACAYSQCLFVSRPSMLLIVRPHARTTQTTHDGWMIHDMHVRIHASMNNIVIYLISRYYLVGFTFPKCVSIDYYSLWYASSTGPCTEDFNWTVPVLQLNGVENKWRRFLILGNSTF
jgi:hypothetical protein